MQGNVCCYLIELSFNLFNELNLESYIAVIHTAFYNTHGK